MIQMKLLDAGLLNAAEAAGDIAAQCSAESNEEGGKKKKKGIDQAEDISTHEKLTEFAKLHLSEEEDTKLGSRTTRSIEQLRKEYRKKLIEVKKENLGCPECKRGNPKIIKIKSIFIYEGDKISDAADEDVEMMGLKKSRKGQSKGKNWLTPSELRDHFRSVVKNDPDLLQQLYPVMKSSELKHPTDIFFLDVLPVPPPKSRPPQFTGGILSLHPQTQALKSVVMSVEQMKPLLLNLQGKDISEMNQETQAMIK